jgi:4-hydroxy-tetrahydrodipicolinate reductase
LGRARGSPDIAVGGHCSHEALGSGTAQGERGMARIGIIGSEGRMGQALARAIAAAGHECAGGVDKGADVAQLADCSDTLVDFSAPAALETNLHAAVGAGIPILVGTTGLAEQHHALIDKSAQATAVLQTGNTSLGITLLAHLVRESAARLGTEWDIEVLEMHHRMKVDAPSGTALLLGEAAAAGRGIELSGASERGRDGMTGARASGTIGFASLRGGTVSGDHSVIFAGEHERIVLSHNAEDRMIFAQGAVRGALWLIGQPAGRYTMNEVLGL